jgi:hypothetical protein
MPQLSPGHSLNGCCRTRRILGLTDNSEASGLGSTPLSGPRPIHVSKEIGHRASKITTGQMLIWQKRYIEGYAKPSEAAPSAARFPRSESFLIIFMGACIALIGGALSAIVSTTLVYSQCHVVPCIPCGNAAKA